VHAGRTVRPNRRRFLDLHRAFAVGAASTCTSTREIPRTPAWAIPPIGTSVRPSRSMRLSVATVSMTEVVRMIASRLQPRSTQ
jgi:hypothetical protein